MLRFFSKIRYQLAAENRTAKYTRYAIGEILLVVIGILIALQVNNWNEHRKEQKVLRAYLFSMIDDLARDTIIIRNKLKGASDLIEINNRVMEHMNRKDANLDTLMKIAYTEFNPFIVPIDNYNTNTLNTMVSTGAIGLLETKIREEILSHQQLQEANFYQLNLEVYISKINEFHQYFPYFLQESAPRKSNYIEEQIFTITDERKFTSLFVNTVNYKEMMLQLSIENYKQVLEGTRNLIFSLKQYIKED